MKRVLFVCYGGGHAAMLIPVIKEVIKKRNCKVTVLALTTAGFAMEAEGIKYKSFKDFLFLVPSNASELGKALVGEKSASSVVSYEESASYHGVNYLDIILQYGEKKAEKTYKAMGRQCFYPVYFMKTLIKYLEVDLLIATNSPRSEKAAFDAAADLQIKSICLVDMFGLQEIKWLSKLGYATKICVLNNGVKSFFIDSGISCDGVVVTGNPAFDSLNSKEAVEAGEKIRLERNWNKTTLLYASQPEPELHPFSGVTGDPSLPRNIENSLRDFVSRNDNYQLVIRYHPSENISFIEQNRVCFSPRNEALHGLLHAIDLAIVTASTVGLEAYLMGKKVISVDNSIFTADAPFSAMGISYGVSKPEHLGEKILSITEANEFSNNTIEKLDATENVIKVIDELL
jgi:hypothetical protein